MRMEDSNRTPDQIASETEKRIEMVHRCTI